jgi:ABC-type transporter Mla maintaining outer membrane lipid asymmetry ATPase subunit MlaF
MNHAEPAVEEMVAPKRAAGSHVVELRDVSLSFGEKQVLDAVSLAVDSQERLVIIGQSGAGKTTILRLIIGILQPTKGSVFFKGQNTSRLARPGLEEIRTGSGWCIKMPPCSVRSRCLKTLPFHCKS